MDEQLTILVLTRISDKHKAEETLRIALQANDSLRPNVKFEYIHSSQGAEGRTKEHTPAFIQLHFHVPSTEMMTATETLKAHGIREITTSMLVGSIGVESFKALLNA